MVDKLFIARSVNRARLLVQTSRRLAAQPRTAIHAQHFLSAIVDDRPIANDGKKFLLIHDHWTGLARTVDLNAPSTFDRTAQGQFRCPVGVAPPCTAAQALTAANATRPILPAASGVRQVNVLMNLGIGDYDGLQTLVSYRGNAKIYAALSYTFAKATNTFNHANMLGRGQTIYGNTATPNSDFGVFVSGVGTATNAIPAFANIDPPRMFTASAVYFLVKAKGAVE
jgi:hypothetical protein